MDQWKDHEYELFHHKKDHDKFLPRKGDKKTGGRNNRNKNKNKNKNKNENQGANKAGGEKKPENKNDQSESVKTKVWDNLSGLLS